MMAAKPFRRSLTRSGPLMLIVLVSYSCASQPKKESSSENSSNTAVATTETGSPSKSESPNQSPDKPSPEYHFTLAQAYSAEGNVDRAIEEYKMAAILDQNSPIIRIRLATEYVKKGLHANAMEAAKEAITLDPKLIDAHLLLAGLYSAIRDYSAAVKAYEQVLKIDPAHEEAIIYKAQTQIENEQGPAAISSLTTFLKQHPKSPAVWYYLGRAEYQRNQVKNAENAYIHSLQIQPAFTHASLALGYLYEGEKNNTLAIKTYKEAYAKNQDMAIATRLATVLLKESKYQEAVPYLEAVQSSDPDDLNTAVRLGLVYMELKNFPKSLATFQGILLKNPDSDRIHFYMGNIYQDTKDFDNAISHFLRIEPDSRFFQDASQMITYLYRIQDKRSEALDHITQAIEKDKKVPSFYVLKASLEEDEKKMAAAATTLQTAAQIFPDDEKINYYLGTIYDRLGKTDDAIAIMETILKKNPQNVDAMNFIGYTWTVQKRKLPEAEKLLKRALSLKPDNPYIQDSWGFFLLTQGKLKLAIHELEKAVKMKGNEPVFLEHLADAYVKANLMERAISKYREALEHSETDEVRKPIQEKIDNLTKEVASNKEVRVPAGKE